MQIVLRPSTPEDVDFARDTHHRAYRNVVEAQFGSWDDTIQDKFFEPAAKETADGLYNMIEVDGQLCGYTASEEREDSIFIKELVLAPETQGKGIGSKILDNYKESAQELGKRLTLQVLHANRARELYERMGFKTTEKSERHYQMAWEG